MIVMVAALMSIGCETAAAVSELPENTLPGAEAHPAALQLRLGAAWQNRTDDYEPRTRHLNPDGTPVFTNRLFLEASPYLRQHAHNPVNWYPWGDDAFEIARRRGRPIFLSIGYSTCHWCHVMERESFEDEEIAAYLNAHYVAIKVDREERPDIDSIYMRAVQMLNQGRGGWPMSVWLTPAREPFFGGTYFPPRDGDRGARIGFLTLLQRLEEAYETKPDQVRASSGQIAEAIRESLTPESGDGLPGPDVLHAAMRHFSANFDAEHGGLASAPKFPSSLPVRLLLRYHRRTGNARFLDMARLTLERMAAGGMHDQVGGGFHRYSTDRRWLVPHFEKMLYDNALLTIAYIEGFQATGRGEFARVARDTLRYLERDMSSPEGGFYSATDADSPTPSGDREEGWFFTWTPAELEAALGSTRATAISSYYNVTPGGNFEGRSILNTPRSLAVVAKELGTQAAALEALVRESRETLYQVRAKRPPPLRDDKILTAWNGLAISAFARAAIAFGEPSYAQRAERAALFVLGRLRDDGRLTRSFIDGQVREAAVLDDYAMMISGLLDLHEASGEPRWLREIIALDAVLERDFEDRERGGFFQTSHDHERLIAREKPGYDGAEPSGNSVHALNLLRLAELTGEDAYRARADATLAAFGGTLAQAPAALSEALLALDFRFDTPKEIFIVTASSRSEAEPFLERLRLLFVPNRVLGVATQGADLDVQAELIPLLDGKIAREGSATAYVCERGVCKLPTLDPAVFARQVAVVDSLKPDPAADTQATDRR